MGTISITVPGDMKLECRIENNEIVDQIMRIIKNPGKKKKPTTRHGYNEIVGIWKDRFDKNISSEMIQRNQREKTWKRY
jgi:hypothetical protein